MKPVLLFTAEELTEGVRKLDKKYKDYDFYTMCNNSYIDIPNNCAISMMYEKYNCDEIVEDFIPLMKYFDTLGLEYGQQVWVDITW